jgi:hypothetical protein
VFETKHMCRKQAGRERFVGISSMDVLHDLLYHTSQLDGKVHELQVSELMVLEHISSHFRTGRIELAFISNMTQTQGMDVVSISQTETSRRMYVYRRLVMCLLGMTFRRTWAFFPPGLYCWLTDHPSVPR